MRIPIILFPLCFISACDESDHGQRPPVEIGRYHFVSATTDYPPLVLDTATGCIEQITVRGEGKDVVVDKLPVDFGVIGKDGACTATGITGLPFEKMK